MNVANATLIKEHFYIYVHVYAKSDYFSFFYTCLYGVPVQKMNNFILLIQNNNNLNVNGYNVNGFFFIHNVYTRIWNKLYIVKCHGGTPR